MADKKEKKKKTGKTPDKKLRIKHDEVVKDFLSDKKTAESFFKEYLSRSAGNLPEKELTETVT